MNRYHNIKEIVKTKEFFIFFNLGDEQVEVAADAVRSACLYGKKMLTAIFL